VRVIDDEKIQKRSNAGFLTIQVVLARKLIALVWYETKME